jgi:cyclopropane-fatty-acyl-phospholipid synthase
MPSAAEHITRRIFVAILRRLISVPVEIAFQDGARDFIGSGNPKIHITVHDWKCLWPILIHPDPALGDSYMDGALDIEPLEPLIEAVETAPLPRWLKFVHRLWPLPARSVSKQYRDIQAHYDRGNAFFSLWLDQSKTYSCAYFSAENENLERAQSAKVDLVLKKAYLQPGQRLLDMGSGWGDMIIRAAKRHGVSSLGITLSREQFGHTRERIHQEGLDGQAQVALMHYRELAERGETFDRIVSVGMLEHVGRRNLAAFFHALRKLLRPGGVAVLHSITRAQEQPVGAWMRRHIFPGAYIPSWREITSHLADYGFELTDVESLRRHYALTLRQWADRFKSRLDDVRALGFDETFIRMWRLYLRGGIVQFRIGRLNLHQFVFTQGCTNQIPLTRERLYRRQDPRLGAWPASHRAGVRMGI